MIFSITQEVISWVSLSVESYRIIGIRFWDCDTMNWIILLEWISHIPLNFREVNEKKWKSIITYNCVILHYQISSIHVIFLIINYFDFSSCIFILFHFCPDQHCGSLTSHFTYQKFRQKTINVSRYNLSIDLILFVNRRTNNELWFVIRRNSIAVRMQVSITLYHKLPD